MHVVSKGTFVLDAVKVFYDHSTHPSSSYTRINNVHTATTPGCPCAWPRWRIHFPTVLTVIL